MSIETIIFMTITVIICFVGFVIPQNKCYFYFQLIWMILFIGLNTGGMDWGNNFKTYTYSTDIFKEGYLMVFYYILCNIAIEIGMDYVLFNFILSCLSTLIIGYIIKRYSKNPSAVMSMLYIFPMMDYVIQKRWYYSTAVILMGLLILLNEENKLIRCVKFFMLCLLAMQFHTAAIFYFIFLVFEIIPAKYRNRAIVICFFIELLGIKLLPVMISRIPVLQARSQLYFEELAASSSFLHFVFWLFWHLAYLSLIYYIYKKKNSLDKIDNFVWHINILSLLIIPLYSFDPVFSRLLRPILVINNIYVCNTLIANNFVYKINGFKYTVIQTGMNIASFFIFYVITGHGFSEMVIPLFVNNAFFNWF